MPLYIPDIPIGDFEAQAAVQARLAGTFIPGTLGALEPLALRLAAISGRTAPTLPRKTVLVLAADHGHPQGDPAATAAALTPLARGRGGLHALARQVGAAVTLVDIGLATPFEPAGAVADFSVRRATRDFSREPALGLPEVQDALTVGMNLSSLELGRGLDLLAVGALGVGGEAAALAAMAALEQHRRPPQPWEVPVETADLVAKGLARHNPDPRDPLDILRTVGGLELAGLVGVILAAAAGRVPIVLDDLVTAAAALLASHLNPAVRAYLVAGHRSGRPAHDVALRRLNLRPLLSLQLAATGGAGALLACHLVEAAARLTTDVSPAREEETT